MCSCRVKHDKKGDEKVTQCVKIFSAFSLCWKEAQLPQVSFLLQNLFTLCFKKPNQSLSSICTVLRSLFSLLSQESCLSKQWQHFSPLAIWPTTRGALYWPEKNLKGKAKQRRSQRRDNDATNSWFTTGHGNDAYTRWTWCPPQRQSFEMATHLLWIQKRYTDWHLGVICTNG